MRQPGATFECKDKPGCDEGCGHILTAIERVYDRGVPIRGKKLARVMRPAAAS